MQTNIFVAKQHIPTLSNREKQRKTQKNTKKHKKTGKNIIKINKRTSGKKNAIEPFNTEHFQTFPNTPPKTTKIANSKKWKMESVEK